MMFDILSENEQQALRRQVATRDSHRCVICGNQGTSIHHLLYRSHAKTGSTKVWQLKNMATLCERCHAEAHKSPRIKRVILLHKLYKLYGYEYTEDYWQEYLYKGGE